MKEIFLGPSQTWLVSELQDFLVPWLFLNCDIGWRVSYERQGNVFSLCSEILLNLILTLILVKVLPCTHTKFAKMVAQTILQAENTFFLY